ncbi:MAG TPA: hypothetical protein VFC14_21200 [Burkholderiales bacterium]|nr:hypothetical protein [Burkholderiales bacterium]
MSTTRTWRVTSPRMLHMFRMTGDGIEGEPAYVRDALADRGNIKPKQVAGTGLD